MRDLYSIKYCRRACARTYQGVSSPHLCGSRLFGRAANTDRYCRTTQLCCSGWYAADRGVSGVPEPAALRLTQRIDETRIIIAVSPNTQHPAPNTYIFGIRHHGPG